MTDDELTKNICEATIRQIQHAQNLMLLDAIIRIADTPIPPHCSHFFHLL